MEKLATFQVIGVGLNVVSGRLYDGLLLLGQQLHFELLDNSVRDFVLDREDVSKIAIESFRPDVCPVVTVNKLSGDAHARTSLSYAAFQDKVGTELFADVLDLYPFFFVSERSVTRDDGERRNL